MVRTVEPHKLVFKQSKWYVYAFCRERNDFRLFKVSRIVSYEIMEELFQLRSVEKIEFDKNYGIELFSSKNQAEIFEVILEYDASDEFVLTDKIDASFFKRNIEDQANVGKICFEVSNLAWAAEMVFSFLDKVRVISPPELQEEIKRRLDKINSRYKGDI